MISLPCFVGIIAGTNLAQSKKLQSYLLAYWASNIAPAASSNVRDSNILLHCTKSVSLPRPSSMDSLPLHCALQESTMLAFSTPCGTGEESTPMKKSFRPPFCVTCDRESANTKSVRASVVDSFKAQ